MRLLVISTNYAPEIAGSAPYTTGLSEHMAALGHEVHVLTGLPHYPSWRRGPEDGIGGVEIRNGVRIYRRWHYVPPSQSAVRRAFYEGTFLSTGAFFPRKLNPDAIVAVVPALSDGILGRWASRRFGAPYGVLFQDLMGHATSQSSVTGAPAVEKLVHAGESWAAKDASAVPLLLKAFAPMLNHSESTPGASNECETGTICPSPLLLVRLSGINWGGRTTPSCVFMPVTWVTGRTWRMSSAAPRSLRAPNAISSLSLRATVINASGFKKYRARTTLRTFNSSAV